MTDLLVLDLVRKKVLTDQMVLTIAYDIESLSDPEIRKNYHGEVTTDHYGRQVPKHAHGTINLSEQTSSTRAIMNAVTTLYDRIIDPNLLVRRVNITANHIIPETQKKPPADFEQMDLFTDYAALEEERAEKQKADEKEKKLQHAILNIQNKFGKNAFLYI